MGRAREPLPTRVSDTSELPPAFEETLERGLSDLGLRSSSAARAAVAGHARLLLAWTAAINLTAVRNPADVARLHVLDSLTAAPLLDAADSVLDLGSGGGYPGLPLAAVVGSPTLLVDSIAKKAAFLEVAVAATGLAPLVGVAAARAETLAGSAERERRSVVTARAVGSLAELAELAFPLLVPGGRLIAWKRGDIAAEVEAAERAIRQLGGGRITIHGPALASLPDHRLVEVTKAEPTPARFPRDPAIRRRAPLGG